MPKNKVQFQKGFSLAQFQACYASEEQCWQALFKIKFPHGFYCPKCNNRGYYRVKHRQGMICTSCKKHISLRVNTLMQNSKLPFTIWFAAIYLITQNKKKRIIIVSDATPRRNLSNCMVITPKNHRSDEPIRTNQATSGHYSC